MTVEQQITLTAFFEKWFKGNTDAMRMTALLVEVAHTWDDLVDVDKPVPPVVAARAFRTLLLELPSNRFYRAHFENLQPVLLAVWASWSAANVMENSPQDGDLEKSYMLRAGLYQLFHVVAALTGGLDWAEEIGPEIYRAYGERVGEHA